MTRTATAATTISAVTTGILCDRLALGLVLDGEREAVDTPTTRTSSPGRSGRSSAAVACQRSPFACTQPSRSTTASVPTSSDSPISGGRRRAWTSFAATKNMNAEIDSAIASATQTETW